MNLLDVDPKDIFRYGSQGVNDFGWGCVYRNVQTLRSLNDLPVPTIQEIQVEVGIDPTGQQLWIEPVDVKPYLPWHDSLALYKTVDDVQPYLLRTNKDDFDAVFTQPEDAETFLLRCLNDKKQRVLLDDSISSYILTGIVDNTYIYIDPHVSEKNVRTMDKAQFYNRPLWMMLC